MKCGIGGHKSLRTGDGTEMQINDHKRACFRATTQAVPSVENPQLLFSSVEH